MGFETIAQGEIARRLMRCDEQMNRVGPFPTFDPELPRRLRTELERRVQVPESIPTGEMRIRKFDLANVHMCEGYWLGQQGRDFEWNLAKARGTVLHRAIAASVPSRGARLDAMALVEQVIETVGRQEEARSLADFLRGLTDVELADLAASSADALTKFRSDWPPIRPKMIPRVESKVVVELLEGRVVLVGKYDLALGKPGVSPAQVVIVDLKTGDRYPEHMEEMRFYALLETLRNGVPPYAVAVHYLDSGRVELEEVGEDVLESAVRRVADGVQRIVDMWHRLREPELSPGYYCLRCGRLDECSTGRGWLKTEGSRE